MASSASKSTSEPNVCHRAVKAMRPPINMALVVALLMFLLTPRKVLAQQPGNVAAQQVKAALLIKFLPFVDWQGNAFANAKAPIEIAVLGDDKALLNGLTALANGVQIGGRAIQVRQINDVSKLAGAHVVFITQGEKANLPAILAGLKNTNALSVGDSDGFAQGGVIINFVIDKEGRVGIEINPKAAARQGIDVSQLVGIAGNIVNN